MTPPVCDRFLCLKVPHPQYRRRNAQDERQKGDGVERMSGKTSHKQGCTMPAAAIEVDAVRNK
jgi:hypothetical protein